MTGSTVSHFRIVEELGRGSMGIVYKAEDLNLDRTVALKFLPSHLRLNAEAKQRFFNEAKAASALDHVNICTIYEIGETKDGQLFIAMAYYEGETLEKKCARGPLSIREALDYVLQMAEGLQRAHEAGIVHRDVKPANVIVTDDGVVKLLDFGIAKVADVQLTKRDATVGTPAYMSPEQTFGDPVDQRSDIWALGAVLYEMLAAKPAFNAEWTEAVLYRVRHDDPDPLGSRRQDIPSRLDAAVRKMLEKRPEDRYRRIEAAATDLTSVQKRMEGLESAPSRRRKAGVTSEAINGIRSLAVLPFNNLSNLPEEQFFVQGVTEAVADELAKVSFLRKVIWHGSAARYKDSAESISHLSDQLDVDAVLTGSVLRGHERARISVRLIEGHSQRILWSESYDRDLRRIFSVPAEVGSAVAREIARTLASREPIKRRVVQRPSGYEPDPAAYEDYLKGQFWAARWRPEDDSIDRAIHHYLEAVEKDPRFAPGHAGLSLARLRNAWFDLNQLASGKAEACRAIELDSSLPEGHIALGFARMLEWDWIGSEESFQMAIELNASSSEAHQWYAQLMRATMRYEVALREARRALELNPLSVAARTMVGWVYYNQMQYVDALDVFDDVLSLDPHNALALYNKGLVYANLGRAERVLSTARKAEVAGLSELYAAFLFALGQSLNGAGKDANASLGLLKAHSERDLTRSAAAMVAGVLVLRGDFQQAFDWIEQGVKVRSPILPSATSEPFFEKVRSHSRFRKLRAEMDLPLRQ